MHPGIQPSILWMYSGIYPSTTNTLDVLRHLPEYHLPEYDQHDQVLVPGHLKAHIYPYYCKHTLEKRFVQISVEEKLKKENCQTLEC